MTGPTRVIPAALRASAGLPGPSWAKRLVQDVATVREAIERQALKAPSRPMVERAAIAICGGSRRSWSNQASKWQRPYLDRARLALGVIESGVSL